MTLIDPDEQEPEKSAEIALKAESLCSDAIMIGGSTGVTQELLDSTVRQIKDIVSIPIILFPTTANAISKYADAIYFMSLLNSRNPKYIIREQMKAAQFLDELGIEVISMGYILIEPGMRVGEVSEADLIKADNIEDAVGYAKAAELLGMKLIYLEAGSGAPVPVPPRMISAVKDVVDLPLLIGGGIKTSKTAEAAVKAGADIIVTGTLIEYAGWEDRLKGLVKSIN